MAHESPGIPAPSSTAKHIEWPKVTAKEEWQKTRNALLTKEKALMKGNDALAAKRRRLPMAGVPTDYRFLTADSETDLIGFFAGRRQLIVYRFFHAPDVENWAGMSQPAEVQCHLDDLAVRLTARSSTRYQFDDTLSESASIVPGSAGA